MHQAAAESLSLLELNYTLKTLKVCAKINPSAILYNCNWNFPFQNVPLYNSPSVLFIGKA
jgi:hypothetical protein